MTRTERRAADRRGTAPTGGRRAIDTVLARRTVDFGAVDPGEQGSGDQLPHRLARVVPPPLV